MAYSRRQFGKMAVGAGALAPALNFLGPQALRAQGGGRGRPIAKPNSRYAGVQIGVISYSFNTIPAMDLIPTVAKLGINEVELMSNHAETLVGAPTAPPRAPAGGGGGGGRGGAGGGAGPAGGRGPAPAIAYYSGEQCAPRPAAQAPAANAPAPQFPRVPRGASGVAQIRRDDEQVSRSAQAVR